MIHVAYDLLDHQPTGWPRWELARDYYGRVEYMKHMFIFEASEFSGLGSAVPACRFVGGARWVTRASPVERGLASEGDPMCHDCMEVSLQHGLDRSARMDNRSAD